MTRHFAITQNPPQHTRWQQAFPQGQLGSSFQIDQIGSGDCVWIMVDTGWAEQVVSLKQKAAAVIVMANIPTSEQALRALAAGARGYIHALSPATTLQEVETVVMNHGLWVGSELLAQVAGAAFNALGGESSRIDQLSELTERERMVALSVANGRTNKEVARELDITERTVKAHMSSIFQKLDVRDRLQLVRMLASPNYA